MLGKGSGAPPACGDGAKLFSPSVPALVRLPPARLGVRGEGRGSVSPAPPAEHVSQAPHPCAGHLWARHGPASPTARWWRRCRWCWLSFPHPSFLWVPARAGEGGAQPATLSPHARAG